MAWGMILPKTFGEFFPEGEYVGWEEELLDYFLTQMPAERKASLNNSAGEYAYYISCNLIGEPGVKQGNLTAFGVIMPHEVPKIYQLSKKYPSLGSIVEFGNRHIAVDEQLKEVIERLEPDLHRFFPIDIVMRNGSVHPKKYFFLVVGQYLDSFLPELSDPSSWEINSLNRYHINDNKKALSQLVLSKQVFGTAHLWKERRISTAFLCFSDQLVSEITRLNLRLPKHYKLKEA